MKNKKIIMFSILIIIFIVIYYMYTHISEINDLTISIKQQLYGEPINIQTGEINNQFFNINSEGKNAKSTTNGINKLC